jgi:YbgC/YbaW family acyl-CoA thioester hydrolase
MAGFTWNSRIRFVDTDASGRIHYSSMFRHLEAAESEFLRSIGIRYPNSTTEEIAFPRVRVECDYLGPLRYDDEIAIDVSVERVGRSSFTLAFDVRKAGDLMARGRMTVAAMAVSTQRSTALPDFLANALRAHASAPDSAVRA